MNLEKELKKFDIPSFRVARLNLSNLTWLLRNLGIRNSNHPRYDVVINEIKRKVRDKEYVN